MTTTSTRTVLVVGDGPVARATYDLAAAMGWSVEQDEAAPVERIGSLTSDDAVVVLSHDPDVDGPALAAAVASDVGYVGAMGSRRTQARRREWLDEAGVPSEQQARIHGPAGLDIGAETPQEIALAVVAEVVALDRGGRGVAGVADRGGPIHLDRDTPADCPGG